MTTSRRLVLPLAMAVALSVLAAGCASAAPGASAPESVTTPAPADARTPLPAGSGFPTETPAIDPPEEVLAYGDAQLDGDSGVELEVYERTWQLDAWPAVPVPAPPVLRLPISCDQLVESAGLGSSLRSVVIPPTYSSLTSRQAGATQCEYVSSVPEGEVTVTAALSVDAGATGRDLPVNCGADQVSSAPTYCRGSVDVGPGAAEVLLGLPPFAEPAIGRRIAQPLLDAAQRALEGTDVVRPAPTLNPASMGVGEDGCSLTPTQTEAVFGQINSGSQYRDAYNVSAPASSTIDLALNERVGTFACWWWLGWTGFSLGVVPGGGWATGGSDAIGTPVSVLGADSAIRIEQLVPENPGPYQESSSEILQITVIASARGSAVIAIITVDPSLRDYARERLVGVTEAFIGTQP